MNTRPLRIFLLGTTVALGGVVGLAPASDARSLEPLDPPIIKIDPDWEIDPCLFVDCDEPDWEILDDCLVVPGICDLDEDPGDPTEDPADPGEDPQDHAEPTDDPEPRPRTPRPSGNPDVVRTRPAFTG